MGCPTQYSGFALLLVTSIQLGCEQSKEAKEGLADKTRSTTAVEVEPRPTTASPPAATTPLSAPEVTETPEERALRLADRMAGEGLTQPRHLLARAEGLEFTQEQFDAYSFVTRRTETAFNTRLSSASRRKSNLKAFITNEAVFQRLKNEGFIPAEYKPRIGKLTRAEQGIAEYLERVGDEATTDEKLRPYEAKVNSSFRVHLAHILIRTNRKMGVDEREAKRKAAQDILNRAKNGESFEELALLSEDKIRRSGGGDLGWTKKGQFASGALDKAFKLKTDELLLAESDFGFHIVKVVEQARMKPETERIAAQLRRDAMQREEDRLRAGIDIEYVQDYSEVLRIRNF
jgi:parvulin-like peptidyl-prolyl isomerase